MENIKMLCAREVSHYTGLAYERCLEILKAHGKKIGARYYISRAALERVLIGEDGGEDG